MAKTKRICLLLVRLLAFSTTLAATIVMATSKQKTSLLTLTFETTYNDTPAFKYFVIANAIVTVYGFLVLFLPSESLLWQLVVAFDAVFTVLLSSTISAALAIAEVGKNGDTRAGWLPICRQVPKYCNQVTGALACGFIGAILYMLLLLHSLHTVLNPLIIQKT